MSRRVHEDGEMTATVPRSALGRAPLWRRVRHQIGRTRRALRQRPRTRRSLLLVGVLILLLLAALLGREAVIVAAQVQVQVQTQTILDYANNPGSYAHWGFAPGEVFDFGVIIHNGSDRTVTLRSITLPRGIPPHVRLLHVVYLQGSGILSAMGWPLSNPNQPLNGGVIAPTGYSTIVLALTADRAGAYLIGPVTVNGEVAGPLGSRLHISQTYLEYAIMCPGVTKDECNRLHAPGL